MIKKYFKKYGSKESKYIHRYYLPRELKKQVTFDEIGVFYVYDLLREDDAAEELKTVLSEGLIIANEKTGWEKQVTAEMAVVIVKAVEAYNKDNRIAELTEAEIAAAFALNKRLAELEEKIVRECTMLISVLKKRITEGDEFLHDWEMDIKVSFLLDEDDPMFDQKDFSTEVMAELNESIHLLEDGVATGAICSTNNWCDMPPDHPLAKERHCWLFHDLYDHTPVPIKHFIHIDDIWAEVKVRYQHFHSFADELKKEGIVS